MPNLRLISVNDPCCGSFKEVKQNTGVKPAYLVSANRNTKGDCLFLPGQRAELSGPQLIILKFNYTIFLPQSFCNQFFPFKCFRSSQSHFVILIAQFFIKS